MILFLTKYKNNGLQQDNSLPNDVVNPINVVLTQPTSGNDEVSLGQTGPYRISSGELVDILTEILATNAPDDSWVREGQRQRPIPHFDQRPQDEIGHLKPYRPQMSGGSGESSKDANPPKQDEYVSTRDFS